MTGAELGNTGPLDFDFRRYSRARRWTKEKVGSLLPSGRNRNRSKLENPCVEGSFSIKEKKYRSIYIFTRKEEKFGKNFQNFERPSF